MEVSRQNYKYLFVEWALTFSLFGYFLEIKMLYEILKVVLDDIPKFWCFQIPYPEEFMMILIINILTGVMASIWFYNMKNKYITFSLKRKFILLSPFLQLIIYFVIVFLTIKYV